MFNSSQLGDTMETSCSQCNARYRITDDQLKIAVGKVRCGECGGVFNALSSLKTYPDSDQSANRQQPSVSPEIAHPPNSKLSLHEAMYGEDRGSFTHFYPLLWLLGILLLLVLAIAQAIYYQRYELISNPRYQQQILQLCELAPCGDEQFSSSRQIKLLERNVFTHPVRPNALMVTGSFVNEAPFPQKLPKLLVTLFDIQGNLIANRQFVSDEYLQPDNEPTALQSNKPIQFRLEILDPGTIALTYEFEFL
ncbi:MAG: putative Zn finger-like uncharacterized protein [Urechidicola sp.]|jgi:predicted Zn finger-like uncharacterized protein